MFQGYSEKMTTVLAIRPITLLSNFANHIMFLYGLPSHLIKMRTPSLVTGTIGDRGNREAIPVSIPCSPYSEVTLFKSHLFHKYLYSYERTTLVTPYP